MYNLQFYIDINYNYGYNYNLYPIDYCITGIGHFKFYIFSQVYTFILADTYQSEVLNITMLKNNTIFKFIFSLILEFIGKTFFRSN